jgi:hypothetical protein
LIILAAADADRTAETRTGTATAETATCAASGTDAAQITTNAGAQPAKATSAAARST